MKNTYRLKNYLKLGILLFGISFISFNCEKEEVTVIENISTVKPSLTINRINESEFISNKKAKERLNWFSNKHSQKNENTQARTVYNPTYDFTIDTDYSNYLEYGNYHSYTFPVIRDEENENLIENFVLSLQNDGTYSLNLYQYDLSSNNNGTLTNSDIIKVTQTIFPEDLDFTNQVLSRDSDPCRVDYWSGLGSNGWHKTREECEEASGGEPCSITRTVENPNCNTLSDNGGGSGGSGSTTTIFFPDIPDSGNDSQVIGIVVGSNPFGGILGGFGTAKDGSNPDTSQDENTSNDSAQDDENDCLQLDENGNCIGDITSVVISAGVNDDCSLLEDLSNSGSFQERMQELLAQTTNNTEVGYWGIVTDDSMLYHDNYRFEGKPGVVGVDTFLPPAPVDSFIHNHFNNGNGTLSVFSGSDLYTVYQLFINGYINDLDDFVMVVATPGDNVNSPDDDTVYAITINSETDFAAFGSVFLNQAEAVDRIIYGTPEEPIHHNISSALNEERLARAFKNNNTGMTLYRGDRNDLNNWTRLKIKNDNTLKEDNCN